ncbi:hypothetical protein DU478_09485 [Thalassococcus profundi]|uniref:Uncharacterized protein n=1 Tax=Thalassococcus profundi TaxID=2282382 RepID=A0A369TP88_9RHOB|nr:hypothetical protein [Thalassococcus profundi]RDD66662.1 hypothetical protein DU478_09485 [Thalassococcus profundi]
MSPLLDPSPLLLAFLFAKKFVFGEAILLLALLRVVLSHGLSRMAAALAALCAAAITVTVFAPALGVSGAAWYPAAARAVSFNGGMAALVLLSALFWLSAALPGRRARWIDTVHGLLLLGLLGLWIVAMF